MIQLPFWKGPCGFSTDNRPQRRQEQDVFTVLGWRWWRLAPWLSDGMLGTESSTRGTGWQVDHGYDREESGLTPRILAWAAEGMSCNAFRRLQGKEQSWRQKQEFGFGLAAYSHHVDIWSKIKYWTKKSFWVVIRQEFVEISLQRISLLANQ